VNDEQQPGGVLVTCMETTGAVVAHQNLQESEQRYRTLFESMNQGFCVVEMIFNAGGQAVDYRFLEVNPVFEKQTGLKDVAGATVRELLPAHEKHWFDIYGKVALTGEPVHFTEKAAALGRWFEVSAFKVGGTDSRKVAVLFTDVSEQKKADEAIRQSEQNLRNIILQSPVAMCILKGPSFIVEIANQRMYGLWGRGPEQLLHQPLFQGLPEAAKQGYEELLTSVYTTGKTYSTMGTPVSVPRRDGVETIYIDLLYEAFRDADGVISGIMAVATDVTEQVLSRLEIEKIVEQRTGQLAEANSALQQINKELQRSNANLEEFAHAASHDLKEPIRKIHFFTTQAKEQLSNYLDDNTAKAFGRIEKATLRMGHLIDDLLLYSHVSQRPHETEAIDLNQKLQRVLEDLELDIEEKKAIIRLGPLPVVPGYRRQLQQLFQNLISNALKYSKASVPPQIDITAEPFEKNGKSYHLVRVTDNGIGFPQQYADKIFQMFTRLHGKEEYSGTGVGLSIVKKVVENHEGMIEVETEPGRGSSFMVYLPA
jgi:PAS domain S-box-containing protein